MKRLLCVVMTVIMLLSVCAVAGCSSSGAAKDDFNMDAYSKEYPLAVIEVKNFGTIYVELYPDVAPNTVNNFISLANSGFYNGVTFHRVIKNFMIQGGDPKGTGTGGPGYTIKGEFTANGFKNDLKHTRGVISMARASGNMDSAGSQFFIMHVDYPSLNNQYASFGKVVSGMNVVDAIASVRTGRNDKPAEDVVMTSVRVETWGVTYPEPEKIM